MAKAGITAAGGSPGAGNEDEGPWHALQTPLQLPKHPAAAEALRAERRGAMFLPRLQLGKRGLTFAGVSSS